MKSATAAIAIFSVICFLDSCSSSPSSPVSPVTDNLQKIGEGGSSQDTLSINADDNDGAYVFETISAEGGSSRDTVYLNRKTRAKFYKIKNYRPVKKK